MVGFLAVVGLFLQYSSDPSLPDVHSLQTIVFSQETIVYARDGKTELARFSDGEFREVATFDELPAILLDATTAVEDKTFWTNTGFDPVGIVSASISSLRGDTRGASTITQQLVRQRLLPPELVQDPNRKIERKLKEIIQSIRVTEAFSGDAGKQQIITAYLNQNFYGDNAYGVKTAAYNYFGLKDLSKLTLAQAAILAAIPQSPSNYDLARNAIETEVGDPRCPNATQSCFIVPDDSPVVVRRNYILGLLADPARRPQSTDQYTTQDFLAAQKEPVVIKNGGVAGPPWKAPHFVWYVRSQLAQELCGNQPTCPRLEQGGLHIITTIDPHIQAIAEKWVQASALVPHRADPPAAAAALGVPYTAWMANLHGKNVWNGAASAIDYQTGEIIAYVGSANYYESRKVKPQFQPQFDVLSNGWRQPGSAFKPFNYVTGINDGTLTASSMFMDVTTDFGNGYTPTDADSLERGPVRLRQALQFSLNIPSVKAMAINGVGHVYDTAQAFGLGFETGRAKAGLSSALGSLEVHPLDLTTAYGTMANRGKYIAPHRHPGHQGRRHRRGRGPAVRAAGGHRGRVAAVRLRHHRHPGRQHRPGTEPHLGRHGGHHPQRPASSGDAQDGHQQRHQGPQRLRLHRPAHRAGPRQGRVRPRAGCLERQQRCHAGQHAQRSAALAGRHRAGVAGHHEGGHQGLGGQRLQGAQRHRQRPGRCAHRLQAHRLVAEAHQRAVHRRHRACR